MDNPRRPSGGVTAAGVITIVFSSLALLGVLFGIAGLMMAQRMAQRTPMPAFGLAMAGTMMVVFLVVTVWGIATGIGGLSETGAGAVAGTVAWAKVGLDAATFLYGGVFKCK
jgi:hypothetical protein